LHTNGKMQESTNSRKWKLSKKTRKHWNGLTLWMNAKIFSNTCSHFLKSTFSFTTLGQNNGNVVQCHPGGLWDGRTRGVGQAGVKWGGHTLSKSKLGMPSGEEKGPLEWDGLESMICFEAFRLIVKARIASKQTSMLDLAH
jgi:hypothetical protein